MTLLKNQSGAISPMLAVFAPLLVAAAGFALDAAAFYAANRELRMATEAAALVAAQQPAAADARARAYLVENGYPADVLRTVQIGRYCPDIGLGSEDRFDPTFTRCPGNGQSNAVRITTQSQSRQYLSAVLGPVNPIPPLAATATAARIDEAGIGVSSGILNVTNRLVTFVNDVLGAIVGVRLNLTATEIGAMANGNVDAGLFFDALARRAGETGTYGALTSRSVRLTDILLAAAEVSDGATAAALTSVAGQVPAGYMVPLAGLFDLGVWERLPVGEADEQQALRAGLNAYQLFAFAVQAGPGRLDLSDTVSFLVPGSVVRVAALGTGPTDRARFAFGPQGETLAGTSALRLQLLLGIGQISVLGSAVSVDSVPVLIDVAAATAEVQNIDCTATSEQREDTRVTVRATSGLVNAYIGQAPANALSSPMPVLSPGDIQPVRLVNLLSLVTIDARAVAQPVVGSASNVVFGPGGAGRIGFPPSLGTPVTVGNTAQAGPLLGSLGNSLLAPGGLQVRILGLCLPLVCSVAENNARTQLLGGVTNALGGLVGTAVDPVLDTLLAALGIQLGQVTVWATGARCGVPVIV
ncbi:MAG: TadG family pilus assembly protein [Erythrobacter sp.]